MGMDATIVVNGERVDAYKCKEAWTRIVNTQKRKSIKVKFSYEEGYGIYDLYVYMKDILTGEIHERSYSEPNKQFTVNFPKSCIGKVEIYVCMKGTCYENPGPFFTTETIRWFLDAPENKAIRHDPINSLKNLETDEDVFTFTKSFMKIVEGKYIFKNPKIQASQLSPLEIEKINKCFTKWKETGYYTKNNQPPIVEFCYKLIRKWNGEDVEDSGSEDEDYPESEAKDDSESEAKDDSESEAKDDSESEAKDDSESEAKDNPESEAKDNPESEAKDDPGSETKDDPKSETKPDSGI